MKPTSWAVVLLVLLATAAIRIRLLDIPLERDEGEYAYAGQLMLQHVPPYQIACNMKLPGTYAAYAAIMAVFGEITRGIHLGLLLANAATILLLVWLGMRLFGTFPGLAAGAAYALMSVSAAVMGTQAHATHFVVLAALGGAVLLLRYSDSRSLETLSLSGMLFGIAFLMKQHGIFFGVFGALYLAGIERRDHRKLIPGLMLFGISMAAPFAVTCLLLWHAGVFQKFWFWTFTYARAYASEISLSEGAGQFAATFRPILEQTGALWILALIGLIRLPWKKVCWRTSAFAAGLLFFSLLAISPGLYFREHYFILLLPAIALLAGSSVRERWMYVVFAAALCLSIFAQRDFLFRMTPFEASREMYGPDFFPDAMPVAAYIRTHSANDSRIAVLGSEPEIYFYAHRRSATSYIYMYALMESQPYAASMREDMIREVTASAPEFVVEIAEDDPQRRLPEQISQWWSSYRAQHYRMVGIADLISDDHTEYRWDAAAEGYRPQSECYLAVYRRIDAGAP